MRAMQSLPVMDAGFGITCLDTGLGRPGLAACYLMEAGDSLAIIETGTLHTVPDMLALIEQKGYRREQVELVIVTHVHLDHAGGAGRLMQLLPNARLVVHPRGARHMMAPAKLQAGATAVYGEEKYQQQYGDLIPVPVERIIEAADGDTLSLGDRPLRFIDTPGHARHHFCVWDETSGGVFTGDTLGIVYRELCDGYGSFVMPTTTPVQFDPEVLPRSIDTVMTLEPQRFFLTHYGAVEQTADHARQLKYHIGEYVKIAEQCRASKNRQADLVRALTAYTLSSLADHGSPLAVDQQKKLIETDMILNAQGLAVWLQQQEK